MQQKYVEFTIQLFYFLIIDAIKNHKQKIDCVLE